MVAERAGRAAELLAQLLELPVDARRASCAPSWPRSTTTTAAASCSCGSPAATASRATPTSRPTSSGSCSTASRPGCRPPRSRRWRSSPTSSRSRVPRSPRSAASTSTASLRTLQRAWLHRRGRPRSRPGPGGAVRHHAAVPRAARPRLARRPAAARRLRARAPSRRGARARPARRRSRGPTSPTEPPLGSDCVPRTCTVRRRRAAAEGARASAASGSRRVCEELIADGRVTVNGEVAVLGRRVDAERDRVEVDGVPVGVRPGLVYYLLNKPAGVVTTASDPQGRPTVRRPRARPSRGCSRSAGSTTTPRGCCCSPTTATSPTGSRTRAYGVEKEYLAEVDGRAVAGGRCAGCARASSSTTA